VKIDAQATGRAGPHPLRMGTRFDIRMLTYLTVLFWLTNVRPLNKEEVRLILQ
jgi:hypothetical protein